MFSRMGLAAKIYTSHLQTFLDYTEGVDNLIWGFYIIRKGGLSSRFVSYVIGLFEDEIVDFYQNYDDIIDNLKEKIDVEANPEFKDVLVQYLNKLPENKLEFFKTGKEYKYLTPIDYVKRIKRTLVFQNDIRHIYAVISTIVIKANNYLSQ